jgi:hypothetical protein
MAANQPIPFEIAVELCRQHRDQHKVRLFSQCWGCLKFSKNDPEKMCFNDPPENRGCKFINTLYDRVT